MSKKWNRILDMFASTFCIAANRNKPFVCDLVCANSSGHLAAESPHHNTRYWSKLLNYCARNYLKLR